MKTEFIVRPGEKVIREFTISPRYFWFSITIGVLLIVIFPFFAQGFVSLLLPNQISRSIIPIGFVISTPIGLIILLQSLYLRAARQYLLTSERVVETIGLFSQRTVNAEYTQITDIRVTQDPFERFILGTGYVGVNTAGGEREEIKLDRVAAPYKLCHQIRELCEERLKTTGQYHQQPPLMVEGSVDSARPLVD